MAVTHNNPGMAILAPSPIGANLLISPGGLVVGGDAFVDWIGSTTQPTTLPDQLVPVRFPHAGTSRLVSAGAISLGAILYKDTLGRVSSSANTNARVGRALSATTGANQEVEVLFD